MSSYYTSGNHYGTSDDLGDILGGYDVGNKSYNSNISIASANNTSGSSKAVLAALRALQDKIRRLEAERSQALDETTQLKHQLRNQEIEAEHLKQRETLTSQKSLQEVRNAYDRLLTEKTELEIKIPRLEERNKHLMASSEELQEKIRQHGEEKHNNSQRIKELELQRQQLELQINHSQNKEKDAAQSMVWETRRHEGEVNAMHKRLASLQEELSAVCQEKGKVDAKLMELEQLVKQLLGLNEQLVGQLSGKPPRSAAAMHASAKAHVPIRKVKKASKKESVPRVAKVGTISSDASRTGKYRSSSQLIPVKAEDVDELKHMHRMYADMAVSLTGSGQKGKRGEDSIASSRSGGSSKRGTRLSKKKEQLMAKLEASQHKHGTAGSFSASSLHTPNGSGVIRVPKPSVSFDKAAGGGAGSRGEDVSFDDVDVSGLGNSAMHASTPGSASRYTSQSSYLDSAVRPSSNTGTSFHTAGSSNGSSVVGAHAVQNRAKEQIDEVIDTLEEEFDALNLKYKGLLTNVQSGGGGADTSGISSSFAFSHAAAGTTDDNIESSAEEIVKVIQQLHKKGEQIRALKRPAYK